MNYFILDADDTQKGVPIFLNAVLAEKFDSKNPMPPMGGYSWTVSGPDVKRVYPEELYLISKDRLLNFDFYPYWVGFIISEEFKILFETYYKESYPVIKLTTIGWKGKKITDKQYYFIEIPRENQLDCIDYNNSKFEFNTTIIKLKGLNIDDIIKKRDYFGHIEYYERLALKDEIVDKHEIFTIKDVVLRTFICTENIKTEIANRKLYGIKLTNIQNMSK